MAQNSLTGELVLRSSWDETHEAIKVIPSAATDFAIELSAADGDTVASEGEQKNATKVSITNASTGVVVPAYDVSGMKSFQIYVKTTATITGPQALTLEVSPHDSDNVWLATTVTATPSGTLNTVVASSIGNGIARRARVSIAAALTTGTADIYLIAQGN